MAISCQSTTGAMADALAAVFARATGIASASRGARGRHLAADRARVIEFFEATLAQRAVAQRAPVARAAANGDSAHFRRGNEQCPRLQ